MYIIEAVLEYLISILVADMYLAALNKGLGISDSVTGILSSVISLGCLLQLIATLIHRGRTKRLVMALSIINQLLFMLLYVIPLTGWEQSSKQVIFIVSIVLAYFFYNIAHPMKINWLMSLVDDGKRGRFTPQQCFLPLKSRLRKGRHLPRYAGIRTAGAVIYRVCCDCGDNALCNALPLPREKAKRKQLTNIRLHSSLR